MPETIDELLAYLEDSPPAVAQASPRRSRAPAWSSGAALTLLARAALRAGCQRFDIQTEAGQVVVDWHGVRDLRLLAEQMDQTSPSLLKEAVEALGESGSRGCHLTFQFPDGERSSFEVGEASGASASALLPAPALRLRIIAPPGGSAQALAQLRERVRFSPLPVYIQGTPINSPILHRSAFFPDSVRQDQAAGLKRNYVERIWLRDAPPVQLMMAADPLEDFCHCRLLGEAGESLYPASTGSTNLQHWCPASKATLFGLHAGGKLGWKSPPTGLFQRFTSDKSGFWSNLLGVTPPPQMAIPVAAVLRWGRPQRGPGKLYPILDGVVLNPLELGPNFPGCWAFVTIPEIHADASHLQVAPDEASLAMVDWTQAQFADMGEMLDSYVKAGHAEALGIRFNFLGEVRRAVGAFRDWGRKEWGDPADDR